ncbi:polysaccharide deacetylase family protein [Thermanaerothrix sp.]|uniref:polysaccharide deacetylase family protein n=1 Tax=Thermanaerothrix sp. TaxID=2972675 RepID=UPI003C7B81EB
MSSIILISCPPGYESERRYIFYVIFTEFLGLTCQLREYLEDKVEIRVLGDQAGRRLAWPDVLFQTNPSDWLSADSLPKVPLPKWRAQKDLVEATITDPIIPVIYGRSFEGKDEEMWFVQDAHSIYLGIDIAGSAFFMLTRYEEIVLPDRDKHNRFPAKASLAYREGFLERPIVDEYIEILWACMKRLWPELERRDHSYQLCLSHDVDQPLATVNRPWSQVLRNISGDIIKRRDLALAWRRFKSRITRDPMEDPHNTFDIIMDLNERYGLKSAFYFKSGVTNPKYEEHYSLNSPWIRRLIKCIHERGHEIGFHPSYETYNNPSLFRAELDSFMRVMDELKISQTRRGGRQHYLRWENPTTWQIWEEAGLDYDATLGFADYVGFRCGTCREFPVFNIITRKSLYLRERPLIAMDTTLLSQQYMSLQSEQALDRIERLSGICRCLRGTFSLLWHNNSLIEPWQKQLYLEALEVLTK